ncbi:MAG: hypothetical protein AAF593_01605 [Planctomycetota bacterium]
MSSNLTAVGWCLLIASLIILGAGWYFLEIVLEIDIRTIAWFVGGGTLLAGGGGWVLNRLGLEILK